MSSIKLTWPVGKMSCGLAGGCKLQIMCIICIELAGARLLAASFQLDIGGVAAAINEREARVRQQLGAHLREVIKVKAPVSGEVRMRARGTRMEEMDSVVAADDFASSDSRLDSRLTSALTPSEANGGNGERIPSHPLE